MRRPGGIWARTRQAGALGLALVGVLGLAGCRSEPVVLYAHEHPAGNYGGMPYSVLLPPHVAAEAAQALVEAAPRTLRSQRLQLVLPVRYYSPPHGGCGAVSEESERGLLEALRGSWPGPVVECGSSARGYATAFVCHSGSGLESPMYLVLELQGVSGYARVITRIRGPWSRS